MGKRFMDGSRNNFGYRKLSDLVIAGMISFIVEAGLFFVIRVTKTVIFRGIHGMGHFIR